MPEEARSESQKKKQQFRSELVQEVKNAKDVVISTPMWNWNIPSVLKAYIDQMVTSEIYQEKKFTGKSVTIIIACGGAYGEGSWHPEWDFESGYLKTLFTNLGSSDVNVIRTEYTLAGVVPGMEELLPKKEESHANAVSAAKTRASAL
jgi:FMN-dependent NADH-azoreductase